MQTKYFDLQLWHATTPTFQRVDALPAFPFDLNVDFTRVEDFSIESDSLVHAMQTLYERTQNIDTLWRANTRSTSVGDLLVLTDHTLAGVEIFGVDYVGFNRLTRAPVVPNTKEIEISGRWVLDSIFGKPCFIETILTEARRFAELINRHPNTLVNDEVKIIPVSYEDEQTVWGYNFDDAWTIEVYPIPSLHTTFVVRCMDKSVARSLAKFVSIELPDHQVQLHKWARIRCVFEKGVIIHDFPRVPYSNMSPFDWI